VRPTIRVVAALIERDDRYLVTQRRPSAVLSNLWEFPGGKVEDGEADAAALQREIRERLDAKVEVAELVSVVRHEYSDYSIELHLYRCELIGDFKPLAVQDARWLRSNEFDDYAFTPADEASMNALLGRSS
jgi:8-oxo-dGTP diphosphatase